MTHPAVETLPRRREKSNLDYVLSSDLDFGFSTIENLFTNGFTDLYSVVKPIVSIDEGASKLLGMFA